MSNLRIVSDNAVDRATLTASSTAGVLAVTNLQTDTKSDVWRATGLAATISALWTSPESVQAVALPFCNLSPTATMRVRLTSEPSATNLFTYSEQFENAAWQFPASRSTITANTSATLAPNGLQTAELVTANGSGAAYYYQGKTLTAGQVYTISIFFKAGTYVGNLNITDYTEAGTASFHMTTKIATASGIASAPVMQDMGNGWFRCSAKFSPTTGGTHNIGFGGIATATTFYLWGAQLEAGALSSYYPTTSAAATRPLGYIDTWQSYAYDSGTVLACPAPALTLRGWTAAQAASAYAYGGGAYARMWLPAAVQAYGMTVDITDANNLQGYVEAARLVAGPYWSPTRNAADAPMTIVDTTEVYRTDAGDQGANAGYTYRRVPIDLSLVPPTDRATLASVLRNSRAYPILVSVSSGSTDLSLERDNMVYGRRSSDSDVAIQYATAYSTTIEIEEI
jgi:hypothetical protein